MLSEKVSRSLLFFYLHIMNVIVWLLEHPYLVLLFVLMGFVWWITEYANNDIKNRHKFKRGKPRKAYLTQTKVIKPGVRLVYTSDVHEHDIPTDMRNTKMKTT